MISFRFDCFSRSVSFVNNGHPPPPPPPSPPPPAPPLLVHHPPPPPLTSTASLVNINVALELDDVSSQTAALILTIVGASFGASFAALIFYDQVFLLAVAWAIAGIAAKDEYRLEKLGKPVSDGVNEALKGLWIALLCLMVIGFLAGVRQRNRDALELEDKSESSSSGRREATESADLTSAIYSS